ncbi:heparinase II/III-family protein [Parapedobacter soli]|uniref:heparinase II/III-family protein n=1 Tax=Parapedobacter soli TaxID=416955 RepID=UPI0021C98BCB|nr:heparinase II/III-family protein [Parapedobacter soli]
MRKTLLIAVAFITCMAARAGEKRDLLQHAASEAELKPLLVTDKSWIPYPAYQDRAGWEKLTEPVREQLIAAGEKYLDYPWRVVKATDYIEYEKSGSRTAMEAPFGANTNALSALVMAELCEGKGRFVDQIVNGVWLFTEMTSWALSAHLPGPQKSNRSLPDDSGHVIDLTAGDMGSFLSWTYYFFKESFDEVNPSISSRLLATLKERILDTYMERDDFWWQAINLKEGGMVNNWNPWCNFNVLTCFMLLEDNPDKLAAGVYRSMRSVDQFINYNHSDGACEEGPSYWGHAAGKLYDYLQLLSYATKNQVTIFDHPIVRNMGEYIAKSYVGNGWVVNFADASAKGGGDMSLIYRYGTAVKSAEMQQFAAYLFERANRKFSISPGRDIFRAMEALTSHDALIAENPALPDFDHAWYNETEFCYMKTDKGLFFAAKGGYNSESHNHNDIGTFSLYADNTPFFIDAGVGTYTRQTFSSERYTIWTMQSGYHNVPKVNGFEQQFGAKYRSADVKFNDSKHEFSLNIGNAYPSQAKIDHWTRSYRLDGGTLYISDRFTLDEAIEPQEVHFLTWAKPDTATPGEVLLVKDGQRMKLVYPSNSFTVETEAIELTDRRLSNVWGGEIHRLILKEKKAAKKGNYKFRIEKLQ